MVDRVKPPTRRRYESPLRKEQAAATARQILSAAKRLLEAQGYPATSMAAVAAEAGVALKTVYLTFQTKAGLLREVWNTTLRGFADIPVADQPWYREVLEEPDPAKMLELNARNSTVVKKRIGQLTRVIRDGAATDPEVSALWAHIQTDLHANQGVLVGRLAAAKALRRGLSVAHGTDMLWALIHPDLWHLLIDQRGWEPEDYQRWLADTSKAQLLRNHTQDRSAGSPRPRSRRVTK